MYIYNIDNIINTYLCIYVNIVLSILSPLYYVIYLFYLPY